MERYHQTLDWLYSLEARGEIFKLDQMERALARIGHPHLRLPTIHIAGTKGKGSVSALIEAALARAGLRVGRYASPHVERVTERVSLEGREIDELSLGRALNRALDAYEAARKAGTPAANASRGVIPSPSYSDKKAKARARP